ncbi:juvenile hormone esterase-like [Daphnia pulex]|uniref:juvenile hormone esterase-like n=1 Tax=Daphnia pulex TaxID=6669 RepID=UPI001EE03D79|nr:juvenile hormone esterase-like [Daphnia pulex]
MKSIAPIIALAFLASFYLVEVSPQIILEVPGYGVLNGTTDFSYDAGRLFYAFRSVFYAEKPAPQGRFLPPVPKAPYPMDEIQQATSNNFACPQPGFGDEDCLSLNVYTPQLPSDSNSSLPVLIFIHGGGFTAGFASAFDSVNRYLDHDIVVVIIQYRLGPLGFMSFDTDEVPGNAGIFDQIEALRWVNKNIQYFGGDPNQVTISGESAGSGSVSLLLLAPQAKGLFHRAIGESGSVLCGWGIDDIGGVKAISLKIAELAGCPLEPYEDLLNCVQTIDAELLSAAMKEYTNEDKVMNGGLGFSFLPVIQVAGAQRIIESDPRQLFNSGNFTIVPTMFGANQQEGSLTVAGLYDYYLEPNNLTENETFLANDLVPLILKSLFIEDESGELAAQLTEKHLGDAELGNFTSMTPGLTDLSSVLFIKEGTYENLQLISQHNPSAFFYSFEYEGRNSLCNAFFIGNQPPVPHGVCHSDELIYLFVYRFTSIPPSLNASETEVSRKMLQIWTNFVKYGDPTPDGVALLDGIPKFAPYNAADEFYMAMDEVWSTKSDYTLTYTVTADELNPSPN